MLIVLKVSAFLGIVGQFLSDANLRTSDLSGADLILPTSVSANLSRANLSDAQPQKCKPQWCRPQWCQPQ